MAEEKATAPAESGGFDISNLSFEQIWGMTENVVYALAIIIIGMWVAKKIRAGLRTAMGKKDVDPAVAGFVASLCYYGIVAFVVIAALSKIGVAATSFVAILGAAGLAVGLALQGSLSNFASGVLILIFKPFKIGDFVELAGTSGSVKEITIFTTELATPDNKKVIVPNSSAMGGNIVNYSAHDTRRVDMVFGIGYGDDIDKARNIIKAILEADDRVLVDPAPAVAVAELADSSVNFNVRPWVATADYWGVFNDVHEQVKKHFDAEGISIPFPQQDVHMHTVAANGAD
ncbi:mechanosensitive ion channel [bacterium SCSIO 12696]|nr:mechanosensitive ion channel [bacterium SCSIO 12696]